MKPLDFPLLADENIHYDVIARLRADGHDIISITDDGKYGRPDSEILSIAYKLNRVILTHDSDFGKLAVFGQQPFTGIIYLRPGHIDPHLTFQTLMNIKRQNIDVNGQFIIIAERKADNVNIRVRTVT